MAKKSKDVDYPKDYAPISHVKPSGRVRRTLYELWHGEKAYMPRTPALRREQKSISGSARRLRKMKTKVYGLRRRRKASENTK